MGASSMALIAVIHGAVSVESRDLRGNPIYWFDPSAVERFTRLRKLYVLVKKAIFSFGRLLVDFIQCAFTYIKQVY